MMKKNTGILAIIIILLLSNLVMAQSVPVKIDKPEIKDIAQVKTVNGKVEPYKSVRISSEIGGIVNQINVGVGEYVTKDQTLVVLDQETLKARVKQAEAAVELAEANLNKLKSGATEEEIAQVEAAYQSAQASFAGAKKGLEIIRSIYNDKTSQKQQLSNADTQLESAKKQLEIAEERLEQAEISYNQAENEYERMKSLYNEGAITQKEFEAIETQYKNSRSSLKTAELGKEQARINYDGALNNYQIAQDVYQNPRSLKQQLENAQTQVEIAKANVKTAKANLDKVKKGAREEDLKSGQANLKQARVSLELAEIQLKNSRVKSPDEGIISAVNIENGEMIGAGTPIVNLVKLDPVYIKTDVNADTLTRINKGDKVSVDILALNDGLRQGEIDIISPVIDKQAQAYPLKILLNNEDKSLRGGMFADVTFVLNKTEDAIVIPLNAIINLDGAPYTFIVKDGKAVKKDIKVGIINDKEVEVIEGLSKTDILVIQGQNSLQNGDPVEVVE